MQTHPSPKGQYEFPFASFFRALSKNQIKVTLADYSRVCRVLRADGISSIARLRIVLESLLTKSPEEQKIFRKCFDSFFARRIPEREGTPSQRMPDFEPRENVAAKSVRRGDYLRYFDYVGLILLVFIGVSLIVGVIGGSSLKDWASIFKPGPTANNNQGAQQPITTTPRATPTVTPPQTPDNINLEDVALLIGFIIAGLGVIGILYALVGVLRRWRTLDLEPGFIPSGRSSILRDGTYAFSLTTIEDDPVRSLSEKTLDHVARSIRLAMNELPIGRLDIDRSVNASALKGGLLSLVYQPNKKVREVSVLVDAYAQPLIWNCLPEELVTGLSRRGVNITYGKFMGRPNHFRMEDGTSVWLKELIDGRPDTILLIFSDGKQLDYERDKNALRSLQQTGIAAWFDLREPRFWDESAWLITQLKMPLFPATENGLLEATKFFVNEAGHQPKDYGDQVWRGAPPYDSEDMDSCLEQLLGDSLPWAECCSMMQPLPLSLAHALRVTFQPQLPPERIERLFRVPGSWFDTSGLHFSRRALARLRFGFTLSWSTAEQTSILEFIIDTIKSVEPVEKHSLEHLEWEWALERVRLEVEPDLALPRIARLARTPLGTHIQAEMAEVFVDDRSIDTSDTHVPLRLPPRTIRGKRIMAHFNSSNKQISDSRISLVKSLIRHTASFLPETASSLAIQVLVGFGRGLKEYFETISDLLVYFPYPPVPRGTYVDQPPGFRNFKSWF